MFHCNVTEGFPALVNAIKRISAEDVEQRNSREIQIKNESRFMIAFGNRLLN